MPAISSCMASHFPPPEKAGGGALATASRMALISAATFGGTELRNSIAGTAASGSSSLLRWKKWINHGSGVFEAADITFRSADLSPTRASDQSPGWRQRRQSAELRLDADHEAGISRP